MKSNLSDLQDIYENKELTVEMVDSGDFQLMMYETLASILIANLVKNYFVHNKSRGMIRIVIDSNSVTFVNSGVVTSLDKKLIFKRFYPSGSVNYTGL